MMKLNSLGAPSLLALSLVMISGCDQVEKSAQQVLGKATESAKQAHYLPAILGIEAWFGTLEDCVDAAITGRWRGRLP